MRPLKSLLSALGAQSRKADLERIASVAGVSASLVKYWNANVVAPSEDQLRRICHEYRVNPLVLKLRMGLIDEGVRRLLMERADTFSDVAEIKVGPSPLPDPVRNVLTTEF